MVDYLLHVFVESVEDGFLIYFIYHSNLNTPNREIIQVDLL